jgi:1-acyl-sn-glycerol-3-phosphate acyltransferase
MEMSWRSKNLSFLKKLVSLLITLWIAIIGVLYICVYGGLVIIIGSLIGKYKGKKWKKRFISREVSRFGRAAFILSGSRVTVQGKENVPEDGPMVIAANHQSAFDIPLIPGYVYPGISFIAKKELSKVPGISWFIKALDGVYIDRGNKLQTAGAMRKILKILKEDGTILLFPEGTRSESGELGEFKEGSLSIPFKLGVDVLPVALDGTGKLMKKNGYLITPSRINLSIAGPISPKGFESEEQFRKEVYNIIKKHLELSRNRGDSNVTG